MFKKAVLFLMLSAVLYGESGERIFKERCSDCHGEKAQIYALGYSEMIAGWPVRKIAYILRGYQSGTYGGPMMEVMQDQVKDLSYEEIDDLAKYINSLY